MKTPSAIDPHDFERLLSRNLKLPLLGGLFGAVVFVGLIVFLLSTIGWVEHTDRVTRSASELQRRTIDMETGMRGFLITGEESFLEPYQGALPRLKVDTNALRSMVADNPQQMERVDRIAGLQEAWTEFARGMIEARRAGNDVQGTVRLGSGKRLMDDIGRALPQAPAGRAGGNPAAQRGTAGAAGGTAHRQRGTRGAVARAEGIAGHLESQQAELEQTNVQLSEQADRGWSCSATSCARRRPRWRTAPTSCSAPAATSPSSWPTCRTSCARR
jgi:CHASE3 domain sensor protein